MRRCSRSRRCAATASRTRANVVTILGARSAATSGRRSCGSSPTPRPSWTEIRELADERGLGVAYAPGGPYQREWAQLARRAESPMEFCEGYSVDVCPPTDNKPFFFNMTRPGDGCWTGGWGPARPVALPDAGRDARHPGRAVRARVRPAPAARAAAAGRPSIASLLFFAAIGIGFLTLEIVLIQRFVLFLGFPTYALSVVLFSLLVFTGIGSLLAGRFDDQRRALIAALSVAVS